MVLEYDKQQNLYLVQRSEALEAGNELCWLPRLYLLFLADDPVVFVHRFASACAARRSTQARLRYNLYIDCMAGAGPSQELPEGLLASIRTRVMGFGNPHLKDIDRQQTYLTELESQVERDFRRAMDKLEFDHVVAHCPESFPPLWLPPQEECRTSVVRKGTMAVPWFPFMERREVIRAASLFTNLKALAALDRVRAECIRAASQSLFLLFLGRPLWLNEFVQIQGQHASKMELFLNDVWISSVLSGLCSALVKAERGWMDIRQNSIEVRCRHSKFL
uniref:Uncharacterized protein n=1 Tax=Eptatretus burgeri TaxID=7764 RepID=A0A8C4PXC9_EPTBU